MATAESSFFFLLKVEETEVWQKANPEDNDRYNSILLLFPHKGKA